MHEVLPGGAPDVGRRYKEVARQLQLPVILHHARKAHLRPASARASGAALLAGGFRSARLLTVHRLRSATHTCFSGGW